MTPITAAPPGREETTTSLSLHPMLMQAAHPNCSSLHTSPAARGEPLLPGGFTEMPGIWIPLFSPGNLQVELNCWHDPRELNPGLGSLSGRKEFGFECGIHNVM